MTVFEYRNNLQLHDLYMTGTIGFQIIRNQEIYLKYLTFRSSGMKKTEAVREIIARKYHCKLTQKTIFSLIKQLETDVQD
jgi:hypothetical protein